MRSLNATVRRTRVGFVTSVSIHMNVQGLSRCTHVSFPVTHSTNVRLRRFPANHVALAKLGPKQLSESCQCMRHRLEVHLAHVEVIAQDTLYNFVVDVQHLCVFFWDRCPSPSISALTASTFPASRGLPDLGKSASSVRPPSKAAVYFSTAHSVITSLPFHQCGQQTRGIVRTRQTTVSIVL
jgi:hypothetical protein